MQAPLLFVLGAKDRRVPMADGLQFVSALKAQGSPTRLLTFPEDTHALDKPQTEYEQCEWEGGGVTQFLGRHWFQHKDHIFSRERSMKFRYSCEKKIVQPPRFWAKTHQSKQFPIARSWTPGCLSTIPGSILLSWISMFYWVLMYLPQPVWGMFSWLPLVCSFKEIPSNLRSLDQQLCSWGSNHLPVPQSSLSFLLFMEILLHQFFLVQYKGVQVWFRCLPAWLLIISRAWVVLNTNFASSLSFLLCVHPQGWTLHGGWRHICHVWTELQPCNRDRVIRSHGWCSRYVLLSRASLVGGALPRHFVRHWQAALTLLPQLWVMSRPYTLSRVTSTNSVTKMPKRYAGPCLHTCNPRVGT